MQKRFKAEKRESVGYSVLIGTIVVNLNFGRGLVDGKFWRYGLMGEWFYFVGRFFFLHRVRYIFLSGFPQVFSPFKGRV